MVTVPPAYTQSFLFYALSHWQEGPKIVVKKEYQQNPWKVSKVHTNARALQSFYASRRQKRAPVTYEMRWEMAHAQRWKCKACKKLLPLAAQVDHVVPLSAGGADNKQNMQMLCANCHAEKSRLEAKQGVEMDRGIPQYFKKCT